MRDDDVKEDARADMTPMIDVVFLMIVFFVCIEFRVLECKLDAFLPTDRGGSSIVEPEEVLSIKVHAASRGTREFGTSGGPGVDPFTGRPHRFELKGHEVVWEVGPRPVRTLAAMKAELERLANDPASTIPDRRTGGRKLMSCVIEAYPGTCYDDVARTSDAASAAGFVEVNFGGGLGPRGF